MMLLLLQLMMMMMMIMMLGYMIIVITDSSDVISCSRLLGWLELRKTRRGAERNETGTGSINGLSA